MVFTKRSQAVALRRKGEHTIKVKRHDPLCLGITIPGVPPHRCTCGRKDHGWCNVWSPTSPPAR
jgi:hypothetical protein